jgi:hypothetical protein
MTLHLAAAPVLLLTAAGAVAADMLPLARGIYVTVGTACKGASNADTLSYWGGNNGINDQQTGCTIKSLRKVGATYALNRTCRSVRFGGSFKDRVKVTVLDRTTFLMQGRVPVGPGVRRFRYCARKVQS